MKKFIPVLIIFFIPYHLKASHDFLMGSGAVSLGYAGAGAADSNEPYVIYLNPSRIAYGDKNRVSFGITIGEKDLRVNDKSFEEGEYSIFEGGFIIPFSGVLDGLYIGLALTFPQPSIMYLYSQDPRYPQFLSYRNILRYSIKPALAYRLFNKFALGVALDVFGDSYGKAKISIDLANQQTTQSDFIMKQKFTYTPIVGLSYDVLDILAIGISYRFENNLNLKIDTNFDMQLLNMNVIEEGQSFFTPAEIILGFVSSPTKNSKLLLDISYIFYSDMPEQYVVINIEPSVLFPSVKKVEKGSVSAKDVMRIKLGVGYKLLDGKIELRAGYQYFPTPIPDQIYSTNILDSDRHTVAIGSGFHLNDPVQLLKNGLDFNFYFQYHYLLKRSFNKVDPLDPYGDYSIGGSIIEGGFGISFYL